MRTFFTTFFASILGGLIALTLFVGIFVAAIIGLASTGISSSFSNKAELSDTSVLYYDMRNPVADQAPSGGFGVFRGDVGHVDILTLLKRAETDDTIKGLYLRMSEVGVGLSPAEELSASIKSFKDAGKFVIAHSQGSWSVSSPSNLLAVSAADEIWMQPGTEIITTGMASYTEFYGALMDNIDVSAEFVALHEYKNAPNTYTERDYTVPHKAQIQALMDSLWGTSIDMIAENRGINGDSLAAALVGGPISLEAAQSLGLVDEEYWPEEAENAILKRAGNDAELISFARYKRGQKSDKEIDETSIAIVGGEGAIMTGAASDDLFADSGSFMSDEIARNLMDAGKDNSVDAIVFRVNSPGGSATASDQIWRAVEYVQSEYGKPVVVSMGSLAASGGYYVSAGADKIVANATTITGSIGIFGGKLAIRDGLQRIGINVASVEAGGGEYTDLFGPNKFTPAEREVFYNFLKRGYDRFLDIVSEGRDISVADLDSIARGRVWTGQQANDDRIQLVDQIGTLIDAIEIAAELSGADEDAAFPTIKFYPESSPEEFFETFFGASESMMTHNARSLQQLEELMERTGASDVIDDMHRAQNAHKNTAYADVPRIE